METIGAAIATAVVDLRKSRREEVCITVKNDQQGKLDTNNQVESYNVLPEKLKFREIRKSQVFVLSNHAVTHPYNIYPYLFFCATHGL